MTVRSDVNLREPGRLNTSRWAVMKTYAAPMSCKVGTPGTHKASEQCIHLTNSNDRVTLGPLSVHDPHTPSRNPANAPTALAENSGSAGPAYRRPAHGCLHPQRHPQRPERPAQRPIRPQHRPPPPVRMYPRCRLRLRLPRRRLRRLPRSVAPPPPHNPPRSAAARRRRPQPSILRTSPSSSSWPIRPTLAPVTRSSRTSSTISRSTPTSGATRKTATT